MGGKRPDQHNIDPDEGRTTDHKFFPNKPEEGRRQADLYGRIMKGSVRRQQPIPSAIPEPESGRLRDEEMRRQEHIHEEERKRSAKRGRRR